MRRRSRTPPYAPRRGPVRGTCDLCGCRAYGVFISEHPENPYPNLCGLCHHYFLGLDTLRRSGHALDAEDRLLLLSLIRAFTALILRSVPAEHRDHGPGVP